MHRKLALWLGLAWSTCLPAAASTPVDLTPFLKKDGFGAARLSPDGKYLAATVPGEDRTGLVVIRRADLAKTAAFSLGRDTHIDEFRWVSAERLVVSMAEQFGSKDEPMPTGELFAVDADGKRVENLVGFRVRESGMTRIKRQKEEDVSAFLVDDLAGDDDNVIVEVWPFTSEPWSRAERMDVRSGRRTLVARAPVPRAHYSTDHAGTVRFARGAKADNTSKLYHRPGDTADWTLVNDENETGRVESVLGFAADNRTAYLQVSQATGTDVVVAYDTQSGERRNLLRDERVDPYLVLTRPGERAPTGILYSGDSVRTAFFDDSGATAALYRMLRTAFPGQAVAIRSATSDGKLALVEAWTAQNPGDFYLLDVESKRAEHLLSRLEWFDPEEMAKVRPVSFKASDGLEIDGFLTQPAVAAGGKPPLVLMPHGGPFGIFDAWRFDVEAQLLARAGYAVLQVNFRGSGNRGRAFKVAGAREWGGKMQDDLTDAVRWAIAEGLVDPARICIVGASYGAYAAMMGLSRTPELYRCGVGYVGVYDLARIVNEGRRDSSATATWLREWVGEGEMLRERSATTAADRIRVPVLLVAGGEDSVAPIEHSRLLERQLRASGVPVETLYVPTEGHGFYEEKNRRAYYTKLLEFLAGHLGGGKAASAPAAH